MCLSICDAAPESAKILFIVCNEAMEKMEKQINLQIHEITMEL